MVSVPNDGISNVASGSRPVAGRLFFGCAQYAAGRKNVRFLSLSNEIFEMSGVNMIRPNQGGEAIESPSPPALKGNWIKIRVKHTPACFYQIVDSPADSHCCPLFLNLFAGLIAVNTPIHRLLLA
jgi:hypothetical protein